MDDGIFCSDIVYSCPADLQPEFCFYKELICESAAKEGGKDKNESFWCLLAGEKNEFSLGWSKALWKSIIFFLKTEQKAEVIKAKR